MKNSANKEAAAATRGKRRDDWDNASDEEYAERVHRILVPDCAGILVQESVLAWGCPVCEYKITLGEQKP